MTPCIISPNAKDRDGYAKYWRKPFKGVAHHRVAWEAVHGPIPPGMVIDHLCRNRGCINVEHLEVVTQAENVRRSAPAQKTACNRGHLYTPENTYRPPKTGRRSCRQCLTMRSRVRVAAIAAMTKREGE